MLGPYISHNGRLKPIEEAKIGISNIEYSYGYGVYETLKIRKGIIHFPEEHMKRLEISAKIIEIRTHHTQKSIIKYLNDLKTANNLKNANIKILLIGNDKPEHTELYIFATNPLYPKKELYAKGAKTITYNATRPFPESKTLNMLKSYIAYKHAKKENAYDALLVDENNIIREGTRTNLFWTDGKTLYTTPKELVLDGVTRKHIITLAEKNNIPVIEKTLKKTELKNYAGYFISSTSTKIMPVTRIDDMEFEIPELIKTLMALHDRFIEDYQKAHASD